MVQNNDDLIWATIGGKGFCSFKWETQEQTFCKNEFNLTGFCSRQSCPLSNSRYATIIQREGTFFLYQKDERYLDFPELLWKKTVLSRNFIKAIQQIDLKLAFWPKFFVYRVKQKLTKLKQGLIRQRIFQIQPRTIHMKKSLYVKKNREEFNKLSKIKIEKMIEHELLNRLNLGVYGNIYSNPPIQKWKRVEQNKSSDILISNVTRNKLLN